LPALHYYFPRMRLHGYFGREPTMEDRVSFAPDAILPAGDVWRDPGPIAARKP
jgi:hypothetical protein